MFPVPGPGACAMIAAPFGPIRWVMAIVLFPWLSLHHGLSAIGRAKASRPAAAMPGAGLAQSFELGVPLRRGGRPCPPFGARVRAG